MKSGAATQYPTMTVDELKHLPIREIADPTGCALFLWTTTPLKREAMDIIDAWGFKYVTTIYWRKLTKDGNTFNGLGFNYRNAVEECWYCRLGHVKALRSQRPNYIETDLADAVGEVWIESVPGRHSEKPDEIYRLIEEPVDRLNLNPKIELFARKHRDGWDVIGNDVDGMDITTSIRSRARSTTPPEPDAGTDLPISS